MGRIKWADDLDLHASRLRQFDSAENVFAHYETTAPELLLQLDAIGRSPTGFVAGVGTGGTVMGVAKCFRERGIRAAVHPLEPGLVLGISSGANFLGALQVADQQGAEECKPHSISAEVRLTGFRVIPCA